MMFVLFVAMIFVAISPAQIAHLWHFFAQIDQWHFFGVFVAGSKKHMSPGYGGSLWYYF